MSEARTEIPNNSIGRQPLDVGTHNGYLFESNAEKQNRLFAICRENVRLNRAVLYVAGKQGVKGIRLSLIDTGFDVASYQRINQFRILDSEELFLDNSRRPTFKSLEQVREQLGRIVSEFNSSGFEYLIVILETDMLVRKGFLHKYLEFEDWLNGKSKEMNASFVCAFDVRELVATGVKDPALEVSAVHNFML